MTVNVHTSIKMELAIGPKCPHTTEVTDECKNVKTLTDGKILIQTVCLK